MGMGGNGSRDGEKNGSENEVLNWQWVGMKTGMIPWEWKRMGTLRFILAHLYSVNEIMDVVSVVRYVGAYLVLGHHFHIYV